MDYAVLIWTIFVFVIGYYIVYYVQIVIRVYSKQQLFSVFCFLRHKLVQESVFNHVIPSCIDSARGRSCTVYIYKVNYP